MFFGRYHWSCKDSPALLDIFLLDPGTRRNRIAFDLGLDHRILICYFLVLCLLIISDWITEDWICPCSSIFLLMDPPVPTTLSKRQQQRARKRLAEEKCRERSAIIKLAHRKEIKKLNKTIGSLGAVAKETEARLRALTCSSAFDAKSIMALKDQISNLIICNQKWDKEGLRLGKEIKRLRSERDLTRSQILLHRVTSPYSYVTEPSSPPLTPRTPCREYIGQ